MFVEPNEPPTTRAPTAPRVHVATSAPITADVRDPLFEARFEAFFASAITLGLIVLAIHAGRLPGLLRPFGAFAFIAHFAACLSGVRAIEAAARVASLRERSLYGTSGLIAIFVNVAMGVSTALP